MQESSNNVSKDIEALRDENIELKFTAIRKDMANLKNDLHMHLDRILEQTSATNGSVAKALERIYNLERQENKSKIDRLTKEFEEYKKQTKFWATISQNKWIVGLIFFSMYAMSIEDIRQAFITLLRLG